MYIPTFARATLYGLFAKSYNVKTEDMVHDFAHYPRFVDFFTREVKPREILDNPNELVSPADSVLLNFSEIEGNDVLLVKGINYKLGEFLTGEKDQVMDKDALNQVKKNPENKLYSAIFYLSPGDYHRYHSAVTFDVSRRSHIVGHLWPVKISYVSTKPVRSKSYKKSSIFHFFEF